MPTNPSFVSNASSEVRRVEPTNTRVSLAVKLWTKCCTFHIQCLMMWTWLERLLSHVGWGSQSHVCIAGKIPVGLESLFIYGSNPWRSQVTPSLRKELQKQMQAACIFSLMAWDNERDPATEEHVCGFTFQALWLCLYQWNVTVRGYMFF